MPQIFNVMSYGATGNGVTDDTVACRNALIAALDYLIAGNTAAQLYFPTGVYALDPQEGDTPLGPDYYPIFNIDSSGGIPNGSTLTINGDGPALTKLQGYFFGLTNPTTNWGLTNNPTIQPIYRFEMFFLIPTVLTGSLVIQNLTGDGGAGWTGNYTVGGIPSTGDGWDVTHKFMLTAGSGYITSITINNCVLQNWRGEIVYNGGGNILSPIAINNSIIKGSNADGVSSSAGSICIGCQIGQNISAPVDADRIYNGFENFNFTSQAYTTLISCTISGFGGYGLAFLGANNGPYLTVSNCQFVNNYSSWNILLSEFAHNITIDDDTTFVGNAIICSVLGLYIDQFPEQYILSFSDLSWSGGSVTQGHGLGLQGVNFPNVTIGGGIVFDGNNTSGHAVLPGNVGPNFNGTASDITIQNGATDTDSYSGEGVLAWSSITRVPWDTFNHGLFSGIGQEVNIVGSNAYIGVDPETDAVWLNGTGSVLIGMAEMIPGDRNYPVGFATTIYASSNTNWQLVANPAWNTFGMNVTVPTGPNGGVQVFINKSGLWQIQGSSPPTPTASTIGIVQTFPGQPSVFDYLPSEFIPLPSG